MIKPFNIKVGFIYLFLIVYIIFNLPFFPILNNIFKSSIMQLSWWIIIFGYIVIEIGFGKPRIKKEMEKIQVIIIILLLYFMIYFFSGLLVGYQRSPYAHSISGIIMNILKFIPIIIFEEYTKFTLARHSGGKFKWYILIVILFSLIDLNLNSIMIEFSSLESTFKYTCSTILPTIFRNSLLIYLSIICGLKSVLLYQLSFELFYLLCPIFPDFDWFFTGVFGILLVVIVFFNINYLDLNNSRFTSRREIKKGNPVKTIPLFAVLILLVGFVAGFLPYQPVAIISNSMVPNFARGDAVVVEKLSLEEKENLEVGDVIQFVSNGKMVVHRIVSIIEASNSASGERKYITKGDNNNGIDIDPVSVSEIKGLAKFDIPKIGYPSVWLYELFRGK